MKNLLKRNDIYKEAFYEGYSSGYYNNYTYHNPHVADSRQYKAYWDGFIEGRKQNIIKKNNQ